MEKERHDGTIFFFVTQTKKRFYVFMEKFNITAADVRRVNGGFKGMSVTLRKLPTKGYSVVAQEDIPAGRVLFYYIARIVRGERTPSPSYAIECGRKVCSLRKESFLTPPYRNIPCIALFSNEPSGNQRANCAYYGTFKDLGDDFRRLSLVSTRKIEKGEEITWCYGKNYERKYKTSCGSHNGEEDPPPRKRSKGVKKSGGGKKSRGKKSK
jgi:hypothetical protein